MAKWWDRQKGFTIVELLIVIVVIAILAAIAIVSYNGIQARAQSVQVDSDIGALEKAIYAARIQTGQTLMEITNNGCTRCSCPYSGGDMTRYDTLPESHSCWANYFAALDAIAAVSGASLNSLKSGDPWGSPYAIDENEGEQPANLCRQDTLYSFGSSANQNGGTLLNNTVLSYSLSECM